MPSFNLVEANFTAARGGSERSNIPKESKVMSKVFVLDSQRKPQSPIHRAQARILLRQGKAVVLRSFPFTIVLKEIVSLPQPVPLRLKIDPGSKHTDMAVIDD